MKTKKNLGKRVLSLALSFLMVLSLVPMSVLSVYAAPLAEISLTIDTGATVTLRDTDGNGYYDISNADELYAFTVLGNTRTGLVRAELTKNIVVNEGVMTAETKGARPWTPIVKTSIFKIYFNGNGKTISGLYFNNSKVDNVGFMGYYMGGTIENVGIINSYFNGRNYVGGIVGYNAGTGCYIKNCYNAGIVNGNLYVGGVAGYNSFGHINNCYNIGEVQCSNVGGGVLGKGMDDSVGSCYYLNTTFSGGAYGEDVAGRAEAKTAEQFANGDVAYFLQKDQDIDIWGQKIGEDKYPVIGGDKVYENKNCIDGIIYSNEIDVDKHNIVNGICTLCGLSCVHVVYENGFCAFCLEYEPATLTVDKYDVTGDGNADEVYEIANAGQLYWFAEYANSVKDAVNAILTENIIVNESVMTAETENARIWTPIGTSDNRYCGVFDGNNKTVSGLYFNDSTADNVGLFGSVGSDKATVIKNIGVKNSYFNAQNYVGGIAGICSEESTIINCYSFGRIIGNDYVGGIIGKSTYGGMITNCYNVGTVSGKSHTGGVVGENYRATVSNCYYLNSGCSVGYTGSESSVEAKTAQQFKSGEVAYLLQGAKEELVWGQKLGEEDFPVLGKDRVYYGYDTCADGVTSGYTNKTATDEKPVHNYQNGFCINCNAYEPAKLDANNVYKIANGGQLYWFADKVNNYNKTYGSANAIITDDIVINDGEIKENTENVRSWIPIGDMNNKYNGVFDGNGKTVSGLYFNDNTKDYVGLIGVACNEIKNVTLSNSYINGNSCVGGIVGYTMADVVNCTNESTICGNEKVGGLVGDGELSFKIEKSVNAGIVKGIEQIGGIISSLCNGAIVENSYNIGWVKGDKDVGGIVGYVGDGSVNSVYDLGTVSGKQNLGCIAGRAESSDSFYNCYYDSSIAGGVNGEEIKGAVEAKGDEEFIIGELAYLLQGQQTEDIWGQTLGVEKYPVFSSDRVYKGYASCSDKETGYTNNKNVTAEKPEHHIGDNGFCTGCLDGYEPAVLNEDNVYEISNAGQLYWFSKMVSNDNADIDGILTDDIVINENVLDENGNLNGDGTGMRQWYAFGCGENHIGDAISYKGVFDGQGHTISGIYRAFDRNLYTSDYSGYYALVAENSGVIRNVGIIDSYMKELNSTPNDRDLGIVAGICVYNMDGGVVENCFSDFYGLSGASAGIVAVNSGTVNNCYSTATLGGVNKRGAVGGIVASSNDESSMTNCYFAGSVSGVVNVGSIVGMAEPDAIEENCYYLDTTDFGGASGTEAKTSEQFKSGEVAYLLQGEQTENIWGQKLGKEDFPVLSKDRVYYGFESCIVDETSHYTNNANATAEKPDHKWKDGACETCGEDCKHNWEYGVCTICGIDCPHSNYEEKYYWQLYFDGSCYVNVDLTCIDCGQYGDYYGDYAELTEVVEAEDCRSLGSKTYILKYEYGGKTYIASKSFEVKSDNHFGDCKNGFCSVCGGYESAQLNDNGTPDDEWDDYFEISNAGQLYWFAEYANHTNVYACAVLTDDIIVNEDMSAENLREWNSIGESSSMPYCGTFNGQGYSISGLYANSELSYIGLFGAIGWGATISNLGIKDSYFKGNYYVGGIVGYNDYSYVINCYAEDVEVVSNYDGSALVGYNYGNVSNSYSTSDSFVGNNRYGTITNCYYLADDEIDSDGGTTAVTAEQFANGEVAYLLQAGVQGEDIYDDDWNYIETIIPEIWGQTIGKDKYPVLGGDKVYYGYDSCTSTEKTYSNKVCYDEIPAHNHELGDIDFDGRVTIRDVSTLSKFLADIIEFTDCQLSIADADNDGEININDATYIQKKIAELV